MSGYHAHPATTSSQSCRQQACTPEDPHGDAGEVIPFATLLEEAEAADATRQADAECSVELAETVGFALSSDSTAESPYPEIWDLTAVAG